MCRSLQSVLSALSVASVGNCLYQTLGPANAISTFTSNLEAGNRWKSFYYRMERDNWSVSHFKTRVRLHTFDKSLILCGMGYPAINNISFNNHRSIIVLTLLNSIHHSLSNGSIIRPKFLAVMAFGRSRTGPETHPDLVYRSPARSWSDLCQIRPGSGPRSPDPRWCQTWYRSQHLQHSQSWSASRSRSP